MTFTYEPTIDVEFVPPMLSKSIDRVDLDTDKWEGFTAEPKHDGVRCLAIAHEDGTVKLYSRTGNEFTEHVPHLVFELSAWMPAGSVIDGELAILQGHINLGVRRVPVTDFGSTMRVLGSLPERGRAVQDELGKTMTFIVYDLMMWDGFRYHDEHQSDRRTMLKKRFPFGSKSLFLNPQFTDPSRFGELFDTLIDHGVEGIIVKNTRAPYVFDGRPNNTWYKVKAAVTMDMIVSGYTEGTGKYTGLIGTVEFSRMDEEGNLVYVGRCSGMTDALRREISANRDKFLGKVIEVKANELVGSKEYRSPRHPQFVAFRFDKNPEDCTGEELKHLPKKGFTS